MRWIFIIMSLSFGSFLSSQDAVKPLNTLPEEALSDLIKHSNSRDTVVLAYAHLARRLIFVDNKAAIDTYRIALKHIINYDGLLNKDSLYFHTLMRSSIPLINGSKYAEAHSTLKESLDFFRTINSRSALAHGLILEGFLFSELSQYYIAAEKYLAAKEIYEELEDVRGLNDADNRMGILYGAMGDAHQAVNYYQQIIRRCKETGSTSLLRAATNNLAETYTELGDTLKAIKWTNEIIGIRAQQSGTLNKSYLFKNLSDLALLKDDIGLAIRYMDSSLVYAKEIKVPAQIIEKKYMLSQLYHLHGSERDAFEMLSSALADIKKTEFSLFNSKIYESIAKYYQSEGDYKSATFFYKRSVNTRDSIDRISDERKVKQLEETSKIQAYNDKIRLAESKEASQKQLLERQKFKTFILSFFSLLMTVLATILFLFFRNKKRNSLALSFQKAEIEKNLKEKETLLKEIHHRVKNNLQIVSSMLNLNLRFVEDPKARETLLDSRNRVKSMALIHQKLYQENQLKGVPLDSYVQTLVNNLLHSYRLKGTNIQFEYEVENVVLDVDTLIPIGLILNELITNSIKHAFGMDGEGQIRITVKRHQSTLILEVHDNGIGFDSDNIEMEGKGSFGLSLIDSLCDKLDAVFSITNEGGTKARLEIRSFTTYP